MGMSDPKSTNTRLMSPMARSTWISFCRALAMGKNLVQTADNKC